MTPQIRKHRIRIEVDGRAAEFDTWSWDVNIRRHFVFDGPFPELGGWPRATQDVEVTLRFTVDPETGVWFTETGTAAARPAATPELRHEPQKALGPGAVDDPADDSPDSFSDASDGYARSDDD